MNIRKKYGFTFIEILVVIAVFAIGVFAVIRLLSSNLISLDAVKTRNSAVFLSKESMDIFTNIKNSNIYKGLRWDCILSQVIDPNMPLVGNIDDVCKLFFSSGIDTAKIYKIGFDPRGYFFVSEFVEQNFQKNFFNSQIYYYTGIIGGKSLSWYGYTGQNYPATLTRFARYVKLKPVYELGKKLPIGKIVKVESHVLFINGAKTGDVVLESFISSY